MFSTLSFNSVQVQPSTNTQNASTPAQVPRARRQQVARACSNCRAYRIKCDSEQPCKNCRRRGRKCDYENSAEVRTFASAVREIERLNKRVQELEGLLQTRESTSDSSSPAIRARSNTTTFLPANLDPLVEHGGNRNYWECLQLDTRVGTTQCYGPASLFYFIARMNMHLNSATDAVTSRSQVAAISDRPGMISNTDFESNFMHMAGPINKIYMERAYEEFYLNIFWEEYHCIYPIIEEADFWNYHRSLWDTSQKFRKTSALIDIILATSLQHGTKSTHAEGRLNALADKDDEMIASRWFYRRCQSILTNQLETPSVMTLQSHMLSVIYLSNVNCQNAAHSILAVAIRVGIILGLHLEPPEHLPEQQREARKRLWWLLYALEMKLAMELGRPLAVNISQVTCSLPSDETIAYTTVQRKTMLSKEAAYLSSSVYFVRLVLAMRAIYITFYDKCASVLGPKKPKSLYETPQALETCARYLDSRIQYSQMWMHDVPGTLKTRRINGGQSFSTDCTRLYFDPALPRWQQQQSVFLELCYHNMMMNLYRPFICFLPPFRSELHQTDRLAASCLVHARSMIAIIYQVLTDTRLLDNHHEAFRWQWNATLSLIGYMIAYPGSAGCIQAGEAVHTAMRIFEHQGECFAIALLAKQTTEELLTRVNALGEARRLESMTALTEIPAEDSGALTDVEGLGQIDLRLMSDYNEFTSAGMLVSMTDDSEKFALSHRNLMADDFFGLDNKFASSPALPWSGASYGEDDEFFRLLNTFDYVEDDANAMLDVGP